MAATAVIVAPKPKRPVSARDPVINKLYTVQYERKRIDADCQSLKNRIKLLQLEEMRLGKRIDKTKEKAKTLKKVRNRRAHESVAEATSAKNDIQERKDNNVVRREVGRVARSTRLCRLERDKQSKVKALKTQSLKIKSELAKRRRRDELEAAAKRERILAEKAEARERRQAAERARRERARAALHERLAAEEKAKRQRQAELQRLEQLEQACLTRLQAKSAQQRKAREALEATLAASGT